MIGALFAHDVTDQICNPEGGSRRNSELGYAIPILMMAERDTNRNQRQRYRDRFAGGLNIRRRSRSSGRRRRQRQ